MRAQFIRILIGIACLAAMTQTQAGLVVSGPSPLTPGSVFDVSLSLDQPWPLASNEVIDQIDLTLHFDSTLLQFVGAAVHSGGLLDSADVFMGSPPDVISAPLFFQSQNSFGPGFLIDYRFQVLPLPPGSGPIILTKISADVIPSMGGDAVPVTDLAPPSLTSPSLTLQVMAVPEPSPWMAVVVGFAVLFAMRVRAWAL